MFTYRLTGISVERLILLIKAPTDLVWENKEKVNKEKIEEKEP